jgi:uncharacterized protein YbaP (TraB family)
MRCLLSAFVLLTCPGLYSQWTANAMLWRITRASQEDTSYLYGTMHSTDDRAFRHVADAQAVLPRCATVAGELDLTEVGNVAISLMDRLMLPEGTELGALYTPRQWKRLEPALRAALGPVMAPMLQRMKPFFILATLSQGDMAADRPRMLDDALMQEGRGLGKRVVGLETVNEQMAALDAIPLDEQARLLYDHVLGKERGDDLNALHDAYAAKDLERIRRLTNEASTASAAFEKALITDRNHILVQRMDSVMRADGSALFLVGAAHLPGPEGLVNGLRALGHMVQPVDTHHGAVEVPGIPKGPVRRGDNSE